MDARLQAREEARKAAALQRRQERESGRKVEETSDYFLKEFQGKKAGVCVSTSTAGNEK